MTVDDLGKNINKKRDFLSSKLQRITEKHNR